MSVQTSGQVTKRGECWARRPGWTGNITADHLGIAWNIMKPRKAIKDPEHQCPVRYNSLRSGPNVHVCDYTLLD